jgi:hypothetical protein
MYQDPPFKLYRNDLGLIKDGSVTYVYNEDGTINWRKMVKPQYLVPNKQLTDETDITKLDDSKILITLAGIRDLAKIRGYTRVRHHPTVGDSYFADMCTISWLPNYETSGNEIEFSALADSSPDNTRGFSMNYLAAIAENRAFIRCVRNFLNINIVGEEEVGAAAPAPSTGTDLPTPINILKSLMDKKGIDFNTIKGKLVEEKFEKASSLKSLEDLSQVKIFELIERLKKAS